MSSAADLPPNWEQHIDQASGAIFFFNSVTRESSWERPMPEGYVVPGLPPGWEERLDTASGQYFYYNRVTKVTQWEKPPLNADNQQQQQPQQQQYQSNQYGTNQQMQQQQQSYQQNAYQQNQNQGQYGQQNQSQPQQSYQQNTFQQNQNQYGQQQQNPQSQYNQQQNLQQNQNQYNQQQAPQQNQNQYNQQAPQQNQNQYGQQQVPQQTPQQIQQQEEPLPSGWEERVDLNGTRYYVNLITRQSQWERPTSQPRGGGPPGFRQPSQQGFTQESTNQNFPTMLAGQNQSKSIQQPNQQPFGQGRGQLPNSSMPRSQSQTATAQTSSASSGTPVITNTVNSNLAHFKFVIVGDGSVGKTCLLISYTCNKFMEAYVPTVFDNKTIIVTFEGKEYQIGLWDTAGQEDYDRLRALSYPNTDLFFLCFAISTPSSYDNCRLKWKPEIEHFCPHAKIILVGTKKDLRNDPATIKRLEEELHARPTNPEDGEKLMKELGCYGYLECSTKTPEGVREVFEEAIRVCIAPKPKVKKRPACIIL